MRPTSAPTSESCSPRSDSVVDGKPARDSGSNGRRPGADSFGARMTTRLSAAAVSGVVAAVVVWVVFAVLPFLGAFSGAAGAFLRRPSPPSYCCGGVAELVAVPRLQRGVQGASRSAGRHHALEAIDSVLANTVCRGARGSYRPGTDRRGVIAHPGQGPVNARGKCCRGQHACRDEPSSGLGKPEDSVDIERIDRDPPPLLRGEAARPGPSGRKGSMLDGDPSAPSRWRQVPTTCPSTTIRWAE